MQIIKINSKNPSSEAVKIAAKVIKNGGVVIYPTDTIYGIGVNALDKNAIKKIYKIKERPEIKPVSVIISGIKMAKKYCRLGALQEEIFGALLPGAFTLVFPVKNLKSNKILTAHHSTLSVRIPDFKITKLLSKELGVPFTATSANISGLPGSGELSKVLRQLENKKNQIDLVLDAGILPKKNPSMIIDLTGEEPVTIRK